MAEWIFEMNVDKNCIIFDEKEFWQNKLFAEKKKEKYC